MVKNQNRLAPRLVLFCIALAAVPARESVAQGHPNRPSHALPKFITGTLPTALSETSGVTPLKGLKGDRLLVVGDNGLQIWGISNAGRAFQSGNFSGSIADIGQSLGNSLDVDDMEDVTWDEAKRTAYILVSGSRSSKKNKSKPARNLLVRLKLDSKAGKWKVRVVEDFKQQLAAAFPGLAGLQASLGMEAHQGGTHGTFNMEGIAYVSDHQLLFGFRSPTQLVTAKSSNGGKSRMMEGALVVTLTNADAVFDQGARPIFKKSPQYLDLGGQGIRGLDYDAQKKGCWVVAGGSANSDGLDSQGWSLHFWNLKSGLHKVNIAHGNLKNAEGICRLKIDGQDGLLLIEDASKDTEGNPLPCHYLWTALPG